jgi:membrane protease YdiL (CAAX protease family)
VDRARVWFVSTLLFALLHLPNWVFGAGPIAVVQVLTAFFAGSMLCLTRLVTGSLNPRCFFTASGTSAPSSETRRHQQRTAGD